MQFISWAIALGIILATAFLCRTFVQLHKFKHLYLEAIKEHQQEDSTQPPAGLTNKGQDAAPEDDSFTIKAVMQL